MHIRQIAQRAAVVAAVLAVAPAWAAPEPVTLDPIEHQDAHLSITGEDGSVSTYDPAGLEAMGSFRITTRTPWNEEPATFDGILLADLLAQYGLAEEPAIVVVAENDYEVRIPREAWKGMDFLVATRVDDHGISRRERGPIQFILSEDDMASPLYSPSYLVWMAAQIRAAP